MPQETSTTNTLESLSYRVTHRCFSCPTYDRCEVIDVSSPYMVLVRFEKCQDNGDVLHETIGVTIAALKGALKHFFGGA